MSAPANLLYNGLLMATNKVRLDFSSLLHVKSNLHVNIKSGGAVTIVSVIILRNRDSLAKICFFFDERFARARLHAKLKCELRKLETFR